jgi:hypothetical protein
MENMELNLVILAAGMGSRYGGLKQLDPVGPNGETILDYSLYDAQRAGFSRIVFVIRESFAEAFEARLAERWPDLNVACVFQEIDDLPRNMRPPADRVKPWGTGHAVLVARDAVTGPFAVINADDYYGPSAFQQLAKFLSAPNGNDDLGVAMVAYRLAQTLSDSGPVSRGLCSVTDANLAVLEELTNIQRQEDGAIRSADGRELAESAPVSMNCWGFPKTFFRELDHQFRNFIQLNCENATAEFYLPASVNHVLTMKKGTVGVLESPEQWFGVTYPQDRDAVVAAIDALITAGRYPNQLTACSN